MSNNVKYNNTLVSGRKDATLTYAKYIRDETQRQSVQETLDSINSFINKSRFSLDMLSSNGWTFRLANIMQLRSDGTYDDFTTLSIEAKWYSEVVNDELSNVRWTRNSDNKAQDEAWNKAHAGCGLSVPISYDDLGANIYQIGHVDFTCEAEYVDDDGMTQTKSKTITF